MSRRPSKQAVVNRGMCAAGELLKPERPSLIHWYGDPMAAPAARDLLESAERRLRARLCRGGHCFPLNVLRMVCHHWLQSGRELDYRQLSVLAADDRERALMELVYGQLLISCKCVPARQHLALGFSLAARLLDTADYFLLLKRHELLDYLPLSETPAVANGLDALLKQAAVIRRLQAGDHRAVSGMHRDTLG